MKKFLAACVVPISILTACAANQTMPTLDKKHPLERVEINYPVTFKLLSSGKTLGKVFRPPKTIDCSKLSPKPEEFKDAIEAGALTLRIETQRHVKIHLKDENGKDTTQTVEIEPFYGGVLALCKVSDHATGLDSRSYNIRKLDDYLLKGRNGKVSVIGAQLKYEESGPNILGNMIESKINTVDRTLGNYGFSDLFKGSGSGDFSWILWLTDRTTTFSNYEAKVKRRKRTAKADKLKRKRKAKADKLKRKRKAAKGKGKKAEAASSQ